MTVLGLLLRESIERFMDSPAFLYFLSTLISTKTHCTGFCDGCKPLDTFKSVDAFLQGCRETTIGEWPNLIQTIDRTYKPEKAVHLFRNPLDNLVARMHLGAKRRAQLGLMNDTSAFRDSRSGLLAWCGHIDQNFRAGGYTEKWMNYTDPALEMFSKFPCFSDLFRFVQW